MCRLCRVHKFWQQRGLGGGVHDVGKLWRMRRVYIMMYIMNPSTQAPLLPKSVHPANPANPAHPPHPCTCLQVARSVQGVQVVVLGSATAGPWLSDEVQQYFNPH
jgi:hypothetical protein